MIMTYNPSSHLTESDIAAWLDRALPEPERRNVDAHLTSCDECRNEVSASQEAVSKAPRMTRPSRIPVRWVGLAAAAAVMVIAVSTLGRTTNDGTAERDSGAAVTGVQRVVAIVNPADGATLGSDRRLAWRGEGSGATYRITIGDDSGQPIHSATLPDTSFVIPQSIQLSAGRKYFWYVDAITSEGTTATSGLNSFTIE